MRSDNRTAGQLRPIKITRNFTEYAEGSVLIECGKTKVICTATVEDSVPRWLKVLDKDVVTAEYSLLPRSTQTRVSREAAKGKQTGRTVEIQRLIGRALRAVVDLKLRRTLYYNDAMYPSGWRTRTASITGAFVALVDAVDFTFGGAGNSQLLIFVRISVGIGPEGPITTFAMKRIVRIVDMNVVVPVLAIWLKVQGTGEHGTLTVMNSMFYLI
ncbi:MAG: ribonuclease PH [Veillonella sp.]